MDDEVLLTPAPTTASSTPAPAESPVSVTDPEAEVVTTQIAQTAQETQPEQPFYFDFRYQVLMVDAALIVIMVVTLVLRLVAKAMGPAPVDPATLTPDPSKLKTVDQLNIDIPL